MNLFYHKLFPNNPLISFYVFKILLNKQQQKKTAKSLMNALRKSVLIPNFPNKILLQNTLRWWALTAVIHRNKYAYTFLLTVTNAQSFDALIKSQYTFLIQLRKASFVFG